MRSLLQPRKLAEICELLTQYVRNSHSGEIKWVKFQLITGFFQIFLRKNQGGGSFFQKLTLAPRLNKEKVDLFYIYGTI